MGERQIVQVTGPATLAQSYAETLVIDGSLDSFEVKENEKRSLAELDGWAEELGYLDFVDSGRSMLLPASFEADEPLSVIHFDGLMFAGELKTHSTVRIKGLIGNRAISALCLAFDHVTLLPYFDNIPDDKLLHVPAFAVRDMQDIAA